MTHVKAGIATGCAGLSGRDGEGYGVERERERSLSAGIACCGTPPPAVVSPLHLSSTSFSGPRRRRVDDRHT